MKKVFTLLLATVLFSSMAWADYSVTAYKGTSTAESLTLTSVTDWQAVLDVTPNAVAIIDYSAANEAFARSTKNIIVKEPYTPMGSQITYYDYYCPNFYLTDPSLWKQGEASTAAATDFYCPYDFVVTVAGEYKRALRGDFNSACVPFDIAANSFSDGELLAYTSYDKTANNVKFIYQNAVTAGTAVIIKPASVMTWTVNLKDMTIKGTPASGSSFTGVFQTTDFAGKNAYSVNNEQDGKFSPLANNLYPFRACFYLIGDASESGQPEQNAAPHLVILNEQGATALDELNANAQDAKFFQNGSLMIRHNGMVYDAKGQIVK